MQVMSGFRAVCFSAIYVFTFCVSFGGTVLMNSYCTDFIFRSHITALEGCEPATAYTCSTIGQVTTAAPTLERRCRSVAVAALPLRLFTALVCCNNGSKWLSFYSIYIGAFCR